MNLNFFKSFFHNSRSKLSSYVSRNPDIRMVKDNGIEYLIIDKNISTDGVFQLLTRIREEKLEIAFHDTIYQAHFIYSTVKSEDEKHWSMTYGNHGRSDGIYQIWDFILARQILSLIKKEALSRIQVSDVVFSSHDDLKSKEESKNKCSEIEAVHRNMTAIEITNKISSKDRHQIWESSCAIIALGQDRAALKPLLGLTDKISDLTEGIELGGALLPNSRFVSGAIKTLKFHRDSESCTCALYGLHDGMNPNEEAEKRYLTIDNVVTNEDNMIIHYEARCTRCGQKFKIEERFGGHYISWGWNRIN